MNMKLIALKSFVDSNGSYSPGASIVVSTSTYGRSLVEQGLARIDSSAARPARSAATFIRLRGPSGLGDAIYLRPIADYFAGGPRPVIVTSNYPDAFRGIKVEVVPFEKKSVDTVAHYSSGKHLRGTSQFQDMCISAGVPSTLPFCINWKPLNHELIERVKEEAKGRKILLVHGGRTPMGRPNDPMALELLPKEGFFCSVVDQFQDCLRVRIGKGDEQYPIPFDLDLQGETSVTDLFDLAQLCDGVVAQCSFAVPLAEIFRRKLLAVWSGSGMRSLSQFIRLITPDKVLGFPQTSRYLIDEWSSSKAKDVVDEFRRL